MKILVRFLLIFICMKLVVSKPQHLEEQTQYQLDPVNEPQFEYPPKDPAKRTLGLRHYALGKHVGIHPSGFKYVLGYSPINIKYVPVTKPVTVLKPVFHQNVRPLWKPVVAPSKVYLPPAYLHVHKPIHHVDHGWKPIIPVKPSPVAPVAHPVQHLHSVLEQPVQHLVPVAPALPAPVPVRPPIHNYFYFQTPVAKPALLPHPGLFHVTRPQFPVLPLGASFPAPVLHSAGGPGIVHLSHIPAAPIPAIPAPALPAIPAPPAVPAISAIPAPPVHPLHVPVHHPVVIHPQPASPAVIHPQPAPPAVIHPQPAVPVHHPQPIPAAPAPLPPFSIEFHGNPHFVPFNNQIPFTAIQSSVPLPAFPLPKLPIPSQSGRQPHALPLPPEVHTSLLPEVQHSIDQGQPEQAPFNPDAAIQPGQTDLQFPMHLPEHPHFRHVTHLQPVGNLEPPFPPFQNPGGDVLRPSIALEPPFTNGYNR